MGFCQKIMKVFGRLNKRNFLILILVFLLLYSSFLDRTPVHLNQDELGFSLNAYAVAKSGYDENGRFFPLYFWHLGEMWATPIITYITSLFLLFLPISETVIRLPSVFVGILNIALVYLLVKRIFKNGILGLIAAILIGLTPVHFIHSRLLLDNLWIVPFTLGWLLLLNIFLEKKQGKYLFWSVFILGLGIHSYHAAKIMMPLYLLMTFFVVLPEIKKQKRLLLSMIIAFLLPLLPLIPWLAKYPDTFTNQVQYTQLYNVEDGFLKGMAGLLQPEELLLRFKLYLSYFDPTFLFLRGDNSLVHSTWKSGVFLFSFGFLLPIGVYATFLKRKEYFNRLILLGFFTAPIAAVIAGDHYRISRALVILPFAVIVAVYGIKFLLSQRKNIFLLFLLLLIPFQFSYFIYDYFTDYRVRSYEAFRYNLPGALESVVTESEKKETAGIYLDSRIWNINRYWQFVLLKHRQEPLLTKTEYFDPQEVELNKIPPNSLILYHFNHVDGQKKELGPFTKVREVVEPDGTSRFFIYRN